LLFSVKDLDWDFYVKNVIHFSERDFPKEFIEEKKNHKNQMNNKLFTYKKAEIPIFAC
jgi:hypothetical protein